MLRVSQKEHLYSREQVQQRFLNRFSPPKSESRTLEICNQLNTEYKNECTRYMDRMSKELKITVVKSLTSFNKAVTDFANGFVESERMTHNQAVTILKASAFLRSCVAGRLVFSQECVPPEKRDSSHLEAINLYNGALIALSNQKLKAIGVLADKPKGVGTKTKHKSGGKKGKGKSKSNTTKASTYSNLFNLLSEVEEAVSTEDVEGEEEKNEEKRDEEQIEEAEIKATPAEQEEFERTIRELLDNEVTNARGRVLDILQTDHEYNISDTIWGTDAEKQFVYLESFGRLPLQTNLVYEFIHRLPHNRMLFHRFGHYVFRSLKENNTDDTEGNRLTREEAFEYFNTFLSVTKGATETELEIIHATQQNMVFIGLGVPTKEKLETQLRMLGMISRIDPLFLSYVGFHEHMFLYMVIMQGHESLRTRIDQTLSYRKLALAFSALSDPDAATGFPTIQQSIDLDVPMLTVMDQIKEAWDRFEIEGQIPTVEYNFVYVSFHDGRMGRIVPSEFPGTDMVLPVVILEEEDDDDYVHIKIHQTQVDRYVLSLVNRYEGKLNLFHARKHFAYFVREEGGSQTLKRVTKIVREITHADDTKTML